MIFTGTPRSRKSSKSGMFGCLLMGIVGVFAPAVLLIGASAVMKFAVSTEVDRQFEAVGIDTTNVDVSKFNLEALSSGDIEAATAGMSPSEIEAIKSQLTPDQLAEIKRRLGR